MLNEYATGKKIYKGGLPNAQSGTLNPSGYIQREQSNRRSGKAAAAMRILEGRNSKQGQATHTPNDHIKAVGMKISPVGRLLRAVQNDN